MKRLLPLAILATTIALSTGTHAADSPQFGGSSRRNNVSQAKDLPAEWDIGRIDRRSGQWEKDSAENVLWVARLGFQSYGAPIVSDGRVYCAAANGGGHSKRFPSPDDVDLGCLLCFRESDGKFLWQLTREKLKAGRSVDWPDQGICSSPLVEGDRLWIVTNRGEVACLDTEGFVDGENDGPYKDEPATTDDEADVVWYFDMMRRLGSVQHNMSSCSVTAIGDLLLVITGNGVDEETHDNIPAPEAPSFFALNKTTGELVWTDASPGRNILHGQWGSPAAAVLGGVPQAIFPGGDGWLYSFLAEPTADKKAKLLWKFDCNPKATVWEEIGRGDRNSIIATPVIHDGLVYLATGQDPSHSEGPGHLWCIDPTRRGDVSAELVVDKRGKPVGPRRFEAVDQSAGEKVKANPNSAAVWHYSGHDANDDGKFAFEETMHRTLGMPVIKDGLLVIVDLSGLVHCLDAKTGKVHWTHDMLATAWGSPLVADGKIFLGNEDGLMLVFELSTKKNLLAENDVDSSVYSAATAVGNVLYIATRSHLIAVKASR